MAPPRSATISSSNSAAERRSVFASRLIWTRLPFVRPTAARIVVAPQRRLHIAGREVERGEPIGIDPDAHGDLAAALDGDPLDAGQRRELRLQRAQQPIGDGRHAPLRGGEAEVERGVGSIGALHFDARRLGFRRQFRSHLLEPRCDLGQRRRAVVVQLQVHRDGADAGAAGRFDVVDAADRGDDPLDRRAEEAANGFGAGAVVDRRDDHR